MSRLDVTYRPNPTYDEARKDVPRLFAAVDLKRYGATGRVSRLPILYRRLDHPIGPMREVYSTSVAGLPLEKGNLNSLEKTIDLYLSALVHFGRLPEYLFQLGEQAWPIYRLPDQIVTRYPGSPVFSAASIGRLRVDFADYFKRSGAIVNRKELGLLALSRADLQLYPPLCMFRAPQTADIPAFIRRAAEGLELVAPVNSGSVSVPLEGPGAVLYLHVAVASYLLKKGRITDPSQLTVRKLMPDHWSKLEATLRPLDQALTYYDDKSGRLVRRESPIYANGRSLVAARTNRRQRTALHVGSSVNVLRERIGEELHGEGKLTSPHYVTLKRRPAKTADSPSTGIFESIFELSHL